ncbi:MAG: pilus assembly protein PilZ [Spirochaetes bacterium]|nr:pilus assembly protein PilZ [Spirochaetota bacterium]
MSIENAFTGKKIFFLHPSALVENKIVEELIQHDFEVYVTKEHDRIKRVLQKFPDSVVFIDIDEGLSEASWENWIRVVTGALRQISVGILSANKSKELIHKYTNVLGLRCGYTLLTPDIHQSTAQVWEHLQRVDAKGARKYLRSDIDKSMLATINVPHGSGFAKGIIRDISVVGLRCYFINEINLEKNTLFKDTQIKLQSTLLKAETIVFGSQQHGASKDRDYVFLFTKRLDPDVKAKIRVFILQTMQSNMDALLLMKK